MFYDQFADWATCVSPIQVHEWNNATWALFNIGWLLDQGLTLDQALAHPEINL